MLFLHYHSSQKFRTWIISSLLLIFLHKFRTWIIAYTYQFIYSDPQIEEAHPTFHYPTNSFFLSISVLIQLLIIMASVFTSPGGRENIRRACYAAYNSGNGYVLQDVGNNTVFLAISGTLEPTAFNFETYNKFGACMINENNDYFGSMVDGTTRKDRDCGSVFKEALTKVLSIWKDLEPQIAHALGRKKTVVITGHSIGGGIASLATLASLEKWGKEAPVYAITFGFPLVGDEILARAVRRQGWDKHFYNVVSKGDVFARTLLAPCISISGFLEALLPYWQRSVEHKNSGDTDILMESADLDFPKYLLTVLQHACAVVNLNTVKNMEPNNKLIASLMPAVKLSPYRPFGYYLFCSEKGALFVENYEAVLPILFYSLASAQDEVSISDHTEYGRVFNNNTNIVSLEGLQNLPLSQGAPLSSAMEFQLDALGLGIQNTSARLALRAAGEAEQKLPENLKQLKEELGKLTGGGGHMTKLKEYRRNCLRHGNIAYYDAFKDQKDKDSDFQANLNRLNLAAFYDRLEEMVETQQLPDDFQFIEELIKEGTEYRLVVEPLDIANYYRLGKHEDSGHYMRNARPRRYKALEKWLADIKPEEKKQAVINSQQDITKDSCFWAHVEELSRTDSSKLHTYVKQVWERNELFVEEVVKGDSTLVKWWRKLSPQEKQASPIANIFVGIN